MTQIDPKQTLSITTTGSDGSATGSGSFARRVRGTLKNLSFNYHASAPATTDVIVSYTDHNGVVHEIMNKANTSTDVGEPNVRQDVSDDAGANVGTLETPIVFQDWTTINVAVAGCDALTGAVVVGLEMAKEDMQRFWDGAYNP
jgi:hypothetical protein